MQRSCAARVAEAANIVPLAFDGQQSGALDGARIDQAAVHLELAEGQSVVLEYQLHRFEIARRTIAFVLLLPGALPEPQWN